MLDKALKGSFFLYLLSLPLSMAGMEIFSWLSTLLLGVCLFAHPDIKWAKIRQFNLKPGLMAIPFVVLLALGGFINDSIDWSKKIYLLGETRWVIHLLCFPIILLFYKKHWESFFKIFAVLVGIVGAYSIVQVFTGIDVFRSQPYEPDSLVTIWRAKGFFGIMTYSHSLSMAAIFLFAAVLVPWDKRFKRILIPCTALLYTSLLLTFTRGAWVSLFVGSMFIALLVDRKKATIFSVSFLTICLGFALSLQEFRVRLIQLFYANDVSSMMRFNLWKANWQIFKDNPVWGVGFEQNSNYLLHYYDKLGLTTHPDNLLVSHSHNTYLSLLGGMGLPGFLAYCLFIGSLFFMAFKVWKGKASMTAFEKIISLGIMGAMINFHIGGLTECNFLDGEVLHMFIVVCALGIAMYNRHLNFNLKEGNSHVR